VLGLVERSVLKRIKLITLNNRSKDTLINLIKQHVKPDTIIYTDGWRGYIGLNEHFTDYKLVYHLKHFVDPIT
jgi:transposase-like protein